MNAISPEVIELALVARPALYGALYGVFANEPSAELLASLEGTELQTLVDALMGERGAKPLAALAEAAARAQGAGEASVDRLEGAYNRLFVGPAKPEAGPWESLHRGKEGTLFCQTTLDVRRCYVEQGLIPQSYPHVADDHVALEIDFVRRLGERARDAGAAGDRDAAAGALAASREFLSDHLGVWVGTWAEAVEQAPHGELYREAARLLEAYVACDLQLLGELTEALG